MIENAYYSHEHHGDYEPVSIGRLEPEYITQIDEHLGELLATEA